MDVVAIAALDESLVDTMAIRLREVCFDRDMTSIAEIGLCANEQMLGLFCVVRRMAVQTSNIVAGMYRSGETPLRMAFAVTGQTAIGGLLL